MTNETRADVIGGFPTVSENCLGCGKPLLLENAWMTDGCPCNTPLGVNNENETRWRLLMQLQQKQSHENEAKDREIERLRDGISEILLDTATWMWGDEAAMKVVLRLRGLLSSSNAPERAEPTNG